MPSSVDDLGPTIADADDRWRNPSSEFPALESKMGEVVQFIPKHDLERARLIQEARAIYEGIFPTKNGPASEQRYTKE
jgi:hypothetical protein